MKNLDGTIALITGSSRGLGKAFALELARRGATVLLHASKESQSSRDAHASVKAISPASCIYYADVSDAKEVQEMVKVIHKNHNQIHILINNAGITKSSTLLSMTDEQWNSVIQTNLSGIFYVTRAITPFMQRNARIINISSVYGMIGEYGLTNYCASKAGVIGFTRALARELGPKGITVNAVCPGLTDAGMIAAIPQQELSSRMNRIPLGRIGAKEEIAKLVAFLCSPDAGYITGQAININGGMI